MKFNQIFVVKETHQNETRVALAPTAVAFLVAKGYRIIVETDAGSNAGFSNADYINAGAKIHSFPSEFPSHSFIIRVLRPSKERELKENNLLQSTTAMLGFLFPFVADDHIANWQKLGITTLSFDLFKSLSIHDSKNAQAAMSKIAGRLALHDALKFYRGQKPVRLTVIGAGAAGLGAAKVAVQANIPVQVFGRKEILRDNLESLGITYFVLPQEHQANFIREHLVDETILITAARTPGKKSPLLIDVESLKILPSDAIVIDLAISNGGNVIGSKYDQIIKLDNGVTLMNVSGYPKKEPTTSSETYAQCVISLLTEIMTPEGEVSFENKLVQEIWVTHNGQRHDSLYDDFAEPDTTESKSTLTY